MRADQFFNKEEQSLIVEAIKAAELNTSGEVRVHVAQKCKEDVLDEAAVVFSTLKIHKTAQRNGVLFFLSVEDKQFAILGDAGINAKVPKGFWDSVRDTVILHFKKGEYALGLSEGIKMTGEKLKTFFPYQSDDVNELDDEISFGKK